MQGKVNPANVHWIIRFKFFNTHGTEITPGSDVVSEYVQNDFIHIDDVLTSLEIASQQSNIDGEIIDVGTGNETSVEEIVNLSNQLSDDDMIINWNDKKQRENDVSDESIFLSRQNVQKLNWKPSISLEVGLQKTLEWYKQNIKLYRT